MKLFKVTGFVSSARYPDENILANTDIEACERLISLYENELGLNILETDLKAIEVELT